MNVFDWKKMKRSGEAIAMATCYDFWSAQILAGSDIDALLVGDSLAMVMHGYENTLHATIEMMATHTAAVKKGAPKKFIVADMPFLSFRKGIVPAMNAVEILMRAGADAIKLEGVSGHEEVISHIVRSGILVMGHLGLTPQFIHQLGGYKIQGRQANNREMIVQDANRLEELGVFGMVLECVDDITAHEITTKVSVPTIGIGAGVGVDGQVLVLHDLLGVNPDFNPKFLRKYSNLYDDVLSAVNLYSKEVKEKSFPRMEESYQ
ncbi:MAG: 3-methyl-2-oxobutanoate hydroxymethyltransferase [Bdellovibrionales bacterium RIFOXYD12_FULL_39_22]|nr:MAG: 3-methyl-2-oxobutanoate hydroxymethyltransferase [Bdellovibrionales bacterium RIFOXYB1_FULL_39_21]OFZ43430.1 MAG: 3-methyl-2-oxobutanoate hydroxymethyltransferase [Bdellovibrionales bacterium RIFOXYC12_FULL_39_17]OFZ46973.1 MAG: 3-methyl-2-oxobutanoate hydroxymethyltransferase [Bdellovibrionales bacterium RIFOXYC1_FULL_39_130]OFZ71866.1 MAG: 3-methyl-2-oxobutanoate hydroxymethyltransferase [Bdellovibrionales bacterium RIFOXYC2_FULL_39_8]OFZ76170.1 MAG: 3-methyl-2-oxobutanoate hydroxymet